MSQALASARKRRAQADAPASPTPNPASSIYNRSSSSSSQQQQSSAQLNPNALTLPQVISVVDHRLTLVEQYVKEQKERGDTVANTAAVSLPENVTEILGEYSDRFDIIADELASLKNMLLSLQSFTMDVNKKLMDERIHLLSGSSSTGENTDFTMTFTPSN
jgi:hypothetical protein